MSSCLIDYDLHKPGQFYEPLYEAIKKLGVWWHCLGSTWIVKSDLSLSQIRDTLKAYIDANDSLLVLGITGVGAWIGFSTDCSNWLKDNL